LVTGTDTAVGKTHVACAIARLLTARGITVRALKPIETGCADRHGTRLSIDGLALARAARHEHLVDVTAPIRLALPASPRAAAEAEGRVIRHSTLVRLVHTATRDVRTTIVEGAGGILVPIGPDGTFAELAVRLNARVLVVARDALGTVNHTALTIAAIQQRNLPLVGIVLNAAEAQPCTLDHASQLRQLFPTTPVAGPLPWKMSCHPGSEDSSAWKQEVELLAPLLRPCFPHLSLPDGVCQSDD
jgi:dethiobiotin synthetase